MHSTVHAFYKFVSLPDFSDLKEPLQKCCDDAGIMGTILLAEEGINGTVAGTEEGLVSMWAFIRRDPRLADVPYKVSDSSTESFYRMKVRLKKEIVALGVPGIDPTREVGTYVEPENWNALVEDPDVLLIDTRNDYEIDVGKFKGALDPRTQSFRDFPAYVEKNLDPKKNKKVAMYCTGGIRCEKATAYMLQQGFEEVYHLKGGILNYIEKVPESESTWEGECFVFDNRVTVNHDLQQGQYDMCHGCRHPLSKEDLASPLYQPGVECPHCAGQTTEKQKERFRQRELQMRLARERNQKHIGFKP